MSITRTRVSVLFSETKIPQFSSRKCTPRGVESFSALQRAENSSMRDGKPHRARIGGFQCSSASRKFLNPMVTSVKIKRLEFQCSSASRKFLNTVRTYKQYAGFGCFSALQRAENSSMFVRRNVTFGRDGVSVLFSEPKIPQSYWERRIGDALASFSALQRAENSSIWRVACR